MKRRKFSRSVKKHIREQKALLRKGNFQKEEKSKLLLELYKKLS